MVCLKGYSLKQKILNFQTFWASLFYGQSSYHVLSLHNLNLFGPYVLSILYLYLGTFSKRFSYDSKTHGMMCQGHKSVVRKV